MFGTFSGCHSAEKGRIEKERERKRGGREREPGKFIISGINNDLQEFCGNVKQLSFAALGRVADG